MTYTVSSGTLNLTQPNPTMHVIADSNCSQWHSSLKLHFHSYMHVVERLVSLFFIAWGFTVQTWSSFNQIETYVWPVLGCTNTYSLYNGRPVRAYAEVGHRMDMLNVASTGMFTTLALIVNLKWYACKKWTSSLKLVVILAQCHYAKTAQRISKYSDTQYTSLTPDKILNSLVYRTLFQVNIYGSYKLLKTVPFLAHPVLLVYVCMTCTGLYKYV